LRARTDARVVHKKVSTVRVGRRVFGARLEYVGVGRAKRDEKVKRYVASQAVEVKSNCEKIVKRFPSSKSVVNAYFLRISENFLAE
jgi:hypothetical protein